jgi:hypothetical protein
MRIGTDSQPSSSRRRPRSPTAHGPWERLATGGLATSGVVFFAAWKVPLGLPGHRALGWLTMLIAARLIAGPGWGMLVGAFSAAIVLGAGISPDGVWGVAQYAIAGVLIDATLAVRPALAGRALTLGALGGIVLLAVGWIAPLGKSLTGGVPLADLWPSVVSVAGVGLSRLVTLDLVFGAAAGAMAWGLATVVNRALERRPPAGAVVRSA